MNQEQMYPESPCPASSITNYLESAESPEEGAEDEISEEPCDDSGGATEEENGQGSTSEKSYQDRGTAPTTESWEEPEKPWKWS